MIGYAASLAITLTGYGVMALSYLGWGALLARFLRIDLSGGERIFSLIWLGWCGSLVIFHTAHFAVPINAWASIPYFFCGILLWLFTLRGRSAPLFAPSFRATVFWGLVTALAVWAASWSMLPPTNYDSGLYHFNSIRWLNEHPLIPGIGNLHLRLAYNQSFFIYAASLNLFPLFNHGHNLASSFLSILLLAECLNYLLPRDGRERNTDGSEMAVHFLSLGFIPAILSIIVTSGISSPAPDIVVSIMQLVLLLHFARFLSGLDSRTLATSRMKILLILAATTVTVKLSFAVFSMTIALIMLGLMRRRIFQGEGSRFQRIYLPLMLPLLISLVWMFRGYLLSGYPLLPSSFGGIDADWAVPKEWPRSEVRAIASWARQPAASPDIVLNSWDWFQPWLERSLAQTVIFAYPLAVSAAAAFGWIVLAMIRPLHFLQRTDKTYFLLTVPVAAGLVFWFFTAPDLRFVGALLFLLPLAVSYPIVGFLVALGRINKHVLHTVFVVIMQALLLFWLLENAPQVASIPNQGYNSNPRVAVKVQKTASGLEVYSPVAGDQCWDSPLPCTPYFDSMLRLRGNDLRSGFTRKDHGR